MLRQPKNWIEEPFFAVYFHQFGCTRAQWTSSRAVLFTQYQFYEKLTCSEISLKHIVIIVTFCMKNFICNFGSWKKHKIPVTFTKIILIQTITWLIEADSSMTYLPILIIDQSPKDISLEVKTLILEISFRFSTVRSLALVH